MDMNNWVSVIDYLPEYEVQIRGVSFVNVLLADEDGAVWPGDYADGKFMVFGVEHPRITHWMYYPKHPLYKE